MHAHRGFFMPIFRRTQWRSCLFLCWPCWLQWPARNSSKWILSARISTGCVFTRRGDCAVMAAPTFVETTMHTHRVLLCLPCMRGRRAVRRAFKHRANHWYNESDSTEDDERTASAFRIGHRAGTAVLPPCSTPQQLTEHQNKSTRRGTAGAFILVELTGVEPVSEKKAVRVSPGAVHLLKFPQCERVHTLDTLVAS